MIKELIELIGNEASLFEEFLRILERQQHMLSSNDLEGLNHIKARRRKKVIESQLLNRQREELLSIIKVTNVIEGNLYVSRLIELVDEDQGSRLNQFRKIIDSLNSEIGAVRSQNEVLLNRSREYVQRTLKLLDRINSPINKDFQNKKPVKGKVQNN
ncbi:MAG TPA: flagellar protein FlgN [candidate division Zixibacteria bacterium]|nr:flagellar protein FlgN [candidate division Zixibacteria bacterium]